MKLSTAVDGYILFKATRVSTETLKTDRVLLTQFQRWCDGDPEIDTLTADSIRDYLAFQRERGLSPYTVIRHRAILSAMWKWLSLPHNGIVDENVVAATQPPQKPRRKKPILSQDEVEALIEAAKQTQCPKRDEALIRFLLDSCCRASEACGLQRADLDLRTGRARVLGKGNKERFVMVGARALHSVWLYLNTERPQCQVNGVSPVFLTHDGYPMDRGTIRLLMQRLGRAADVTRLYAHLLRHTGAVFRLRAGMNLEMLREFLGHTTLEMTRQYLTGLTDEDVAAAASRTSPGDNWRL